MDFKSIRNDVVVAFLAQGIAFALSALTTLIVPKVIGVEEFGYWQLFLFYTTYVGFFHFGLNDGVYLLNGGKKREEIDQRSITSQFVAGLVVQCIIASGLIVVAIGFDVDPSRTFVLVATALYLVICNATNYLGFLFQAIGETKLYSISVIVDKLVFLVPLLLFIIFGCERFEPYVVFWCVAKTCSALYCIWHARDVLRSQLLPTKMAISKSLQSVKVGILLTLANISSSLVLGVLRFAVDSQWDIATFGKVSLAITMVNFFLSMISQVAMVLFPALRRADKSEQSSFFRMERDLLSLVLPIAFLLYMPMCHFISRWLPQYDESLVYFAFLLPLCLFDGKMNLISTTFMKVLRLERELLLINIAAVLASCLCVFLGIYNLHNIELSICMITCVIVIRSIYSESMLMRRFGIRNSREMLWDLFITVGFLMCTFLFGYSLTSAISVSVLYLIYLIANKERIKRLQAYRSSTL